MPSNGDLKCFEHQQASTLDRNSFAEGDDSVEHSRICEICGGRYTTLLESYTVSKWPVVACEDYGFVFLGRPPDCDLLNTEYAWEKTSTKEKKKARPEIVGGVRPSDAAAH